MKARTFLNCGVALQVMLVGSVAPASAEPTSFVQRVHEKFPATVGSKIEPAFPGFWSVVKGAEVLFIRDDLSVLIPGDVVDLRTNQSLASKIRADNKPHISPKDFDVKDAFSFGSGTRRLFVFSDPDCPFCRQLEPQLAKLSNVQIFVFPFPLVGLHAHARIVSETLWCQHDRATAWRQYLLGGAAPAPATCDNPISRNLALGERLQVLGTPALVFEDGAVVPGAVSAERIEAQLAASASAVSNAVATAPPSKHFAPHPVVSQ